MRVPVPSNGMGMVCLVLGHIAPFMQRKEKHRKSQGNTVQQHLASQVQTDTLWETHQKTKDQIKEFNDFS